MFDIFGRKADDIYDTPTTQESLQKLLDMEEVLMKKQAFLEGKIKEALENASMNADMLKVMVNASIALKTANSNVDADNVHDLMEDIAEQQEVANEIAEAISRPIALNSQVDDDELLVELEELEQEELDKLLLEAHPTTVSLPDVPFREIPIASTTKIKDYDDLDTLSNWAMN